MSVPERRGDKGSERNDGNPYLYLTLGISFALAAVMIIATTGVLVTGIGFVIPAAILLGLSVNDFQQQRHLLPTPVTKERELLSAIRDNGGSITPAEAAMETSLTVREADSMLLEMTGGGYLQVEVQSGSLHYSLPGGDKPKLQG